jgi:hypothetical protein
MMQDVALILAGCVLSAFIYALGFRLGRLHRKLTDRRPEPHA